MLRAADYPAKPRDVLEKYLALDAEAAGIAANTWPEMSRYTTWPDLSGWDHFIVIEGYTVDKIIQGTTRAQAKVTYQPLGQLSDQFAVDLKPETVLFHLNKVQNQWKVDGPQAPPHVAYRVIQKRLSAASLANPKAKPTNDALLAQMESARQQLKH
jgi:hypothetical protein